MLKAIERPLAASIAPELTHTESACANGLNARAWLDLKEGLRSWRFWLLLGISDIRQRYRRSRIGQFWITISVAIFIAAIGLVYSAIFRQPVSEYIPYLATTFIVWGLISGIVIDGTTAFIQAEGFLRQQAIPKTSFIFRILTRNIVSFCHNFIIIPVVFILFGVPPAWTWVAALGGLMMILIAGFFAGLICAILCTRFRDLPQIAQNVMQVAFFVSPVTWQIELISEQSRHWVTINPFASFLRIVSEPLLGRLPDPVTYASATSIIIFLSLVAWLLFGRYRHRIVYWL